MIYFIDVHPETIGWEGKPVTKVGISKNVDKRMQELAIGNPIDMELVAKIESENCENVEKVIHSLISKYHVRGEWYKLPNEIVGWAEKSTRIDKAEEKRLETLELLVMAN